MCGCGHVRACKADAGMCCCPQCTTLTLIVKTPAALARAGLLWRFLRPPELLLLTHRCGAPHASQCAPACCACARIACYSSAAALQRVCRCTLLSRPRVCESSHASRYTPVLPRFSYRHAGFQNNPVPWWVIIVADVGMMLSMALVTLPLYSLVAHTYTPNAAVLRAKARAAAHHHAAAAGGKAH